MQGGQVGDESYELSSLSVMSLKVRDDVVRKASQPPADRFGVHFDYHDLCARLREVEQQQQSHPLNTSVKLVARKYSRQPTSQKQRSLISTYANTGELKKVLGVKLGDTSHLNISRSTMNRSFTPNKLKGKKMLNKTQSRISTKMPVKHIRQASLPMFVEPLPQKPLSKLHKKSASIYSTVDF